MDFVPSLTYLFSEGDWQTRRLLRMDFPRGDGPEARMLVNSLDADEAVSRDFSYTIEVLSDDARIPITDVMGRMVTVSLVRDDGTLRYFNGYVTEFGFVKTDGGFAYYRMVLSPWLALLRLRQNCALFQRMNLTEICEKTFENYLQRDFQCRLIAQLPDIPLAVQYNETDHNHIHRRLEDAGLFYWYEHRFDGHTLWISDDNSYARPIDADTATIVYRAESGSLEDDGISAWMPSQAARTGKAAVGSYDFKHATPMNSERDSLLKQGTILSLETFENTGSYGFANETAAEALAVCRIDQLTCDGETVAARGNHRSIQPGRCFALSEHFSFDPDARQYFVLAVRHTASNNYQGDKNSGSEYSNEVQCVRKDLRWRPPRGYHSTETRIFGVQTATVVALQGQEVHTDEYGRVRVQFHWDRVGKKNPASSPWIRVMTGWAGSRFGQISLPRAGQEVVVQFLEGNCDRPIIVGAVYNATHLPPWELCKEHSLAGFRSRELNGPRGNQLVLDDTNQKIQVQLKSDHQHSQLSLGHIGRIDDHHGRKDDRGEGWEIATEAWGVARAGKGMLITTEARPGAASHIKSMDETLQRLADAAERQAESAAQAQKYGAQDAPEQQQAVASEIADQNSAIEGKGRTGNFPELAQPHLVISSAAGLHTTSTQSSHFTSAEHLAITSGRNISAVAGDSLFASIKHTLRIFVHKAGIRMVAAAGPVSIHAREDDVEAVAKKVIRLISESDWVDIRGKKGIRLHGAGSMVEISDKVQFFTEAPTLFHGNLETLAPKNSPQPEIPVEDVVPGPEFLHFTLQSHASGGVRYSDVPYSILKGGAEIDSGLTDRLGRIIIKHEPGTPEYTIRLANGEEFKLKACERLAAQGESGHEEQSHSNQGRRALDDTPGSRLQD